MTTRLRSEQWWNDPGNPGMTALYLERFLNSGLTPGELQGGRAVIGIAQSASDLTPCNRVHLESVKRLCDGVRDAGGLPLVFPMHLRGTGESFAANIGGRVLGTAAAFITITLSESKPPDPAKIALMGAYVAGAYALVGAILTQWLPEPPKEGLHE